MRRLVTSGSAKPVFRDAHDRRHFFPKPEYRFDNVPYRLLEQYVELEPWTSTRQRRCEEQIAGKWHVIAPQEALEDLQHERLTHHFYITFAGCAVMVNKDTFHSDTAKSYLHDNNGHQTVREGQSGWVLQAVSRASFRRLPRNGKSYFTMMSLHINASAKKRGIAKNLLLTVRTVMHQQQVDLVAGDFNGAAWRRQTSSDSRFISSIEDAFVNTNSPLPPGPTPLWGPGGVPGEWSDACGFSKSPGSENEWRVRMHGAFTIPYSALCLKEKDQSCHHEVWIHLLHVNARMVDRFSCEDKHRRPISRKRNSPCDHIKERRQNR